MDKKKRPAGVIIFAWSIFIGSVLSLLAYKFSLKINPPISSFLYLPISIASAISAVYLLRMKEWARTVIMIISILVVMETMMTIPYCVNKYNQFVAREFDNVYNMGIDAALGKASPDQTLVEENFRDQMESNRGNVKNTALAIGSILMQLMILITVGFNCGVLYYFDRPKVKEQFRSA